MHTEVLERRFAAIGARLNVSRPTDGRAAHRRSHGRAGRVLRRPLRRRRPRGRVEVVDVGRTDRHLLLLVRDGEEKSKFLCGHDERHWFVAGDPRDRPRRQRCRDGEGSAAAAACTRRRSSGSGRRTAFRRRNAAYVRQGEWFFVPAPGLDAAEPRSCCATSRCRAAAARRTCSSSRIRRGGETVWVNSRHPSGISEPAYRAPDARSSGGSGGWNALVRDPELFAKGADPPSRPRDDRTARLAPRVR